MRAFWLTLLATGLLLVTIDIYEAPRTGSTKRAPSPMDDGSGIPNPSPTPKPK